MAERRDSTRRQGELGGLLYAVVMATVAFGPVPDRRRGRCGEGAREKDLGLPRVSAVVFLSTRRPVAMRGGEEASWCDCDGEPVVGCACVQGVRERPTQMGRATLLGQLGQVHSALFPFPFSFTTLPFSFCLEIVWPPKHY